MDIIFVKCNDYIFRIFYFWKHIYMKQRCQWCTNDELYQKYHDTEWAVPSFDDRYLFEMLILEGAQAGLSWLTVLRKRSHYQQVYDNFEPELVAVYDEVKIAELLSDPGIIRNRLKVNSSVLNAQLFLQVQQQYGSFADYIWHFVGGQAKINHWNNLSEVPVMTEESDKMSRDLKKKGFKFVGSTICYAYMQAVGMVNDHTVDCFCHVED